jgi:hypothetical protein
MIGTRSQLGAAGAVLGMLVEVAGCKSPESTSAPPPPASRAPAAGSAAAAEPAATPPVESTRVIVLDAPKIDLPKLESFTLLGDGTGKKSALRYSLAATSFALVAQTQLSSRHLADNGFTAPVALPAIRDGFTVTTTAAARGQLALRALPGQLAAASADGDAYLASWRTLLQDRRMTVAIDDRGMFTTIAFVDDPGAPRNALAKDELVQRLASTTVPLPVEPIGTGASWKVVTILRQGLAYAKQTATYTLLSTSPAGWKLHVKLQRVAEEQSIADPSLPAGVTADLLAMFRLLEGDVEIAPQQPLITGGSLTIESRMHVRLQAGKQPPTEQMFEDTGTVAFSRCHAAAAVPAAAPVAAVNQAHQAGACPDGFVP